MSIFESIPKHFVSIGMINTYRKLGSFDIERAVIDKKIKFEKNLKINLKGTY